jgi:hypothetical protein
MHKIERAVLRGWMGIILDSCLAKPVQGGLREAQAPKTSGKDQEKRGVARCGQSRVAERSIIGARGRKC